MAICLRACYERTFRSLSVHASFPGNPHFICTLSIRGVICRPLLDLEGCSGPFPSAHRTRVHTEGGMKTKPSRVTPHKHERVEEIALGIVHVNALVCFSMLRLASLACEVTASHHHYRI